MGRAILRTYTDSISELHCKVERDIFDAKNVCSRMATM